MHERDAVAALGFVHEVGGDEDGDLVAPGQLHHQPPEVVARNRVHARGGLIQDQQLGLVHHGHGQRQALAHAQRQLHGQRAACGLQVKPLQHGLHALGHLGLWHMKQPGVQHQVLLYRQLAVQRERLRHIAHAAARGHVFRVHRLAKQPGLAVGGGQQAGEHLHGGGLAAPVAAQKAKNLAALDAKAHMVHRHKVAKLHGQALGLDGDLCRRIGLQGGDDHRLVPAPLGLGQQGHKRGFQAGMAGAIRLAGEAALRTGSGLVTVGTDPSHAAWLNLTRPELMVTALQANELNELLAGKTIIGLGPGLGQTAVAQAIWANTLKTNLPLVLDADALNLLAQAPQQRSNWILTPHPAEAARLLAGSTQEIEQDRFAAIRALQQKYGGVIVLKGAGSLIADDEQIALCLAGNPGMSTAGMGDVLTGIIASLLGQGLSLWEAACAGVLIHALAGDKAAKQGERGMLASDLINNLREWVNP